MSVRTVSGIVRDVSFEAEEQQEIFEALSDAFGRYPFECLRSAAERVIAQRYPEDEPVMRAARIVCDLDRRRASAYGDGVDSNKVDLGKVAWQGLAEARACLMEPEH